LAHCWRRSSISKAHAVPTRPTDNSTFGTSISLVSHYCGSPAHYPCVLVHFLVPPFSQAVLLPSHCCPLDSISQPSPSLSAHINFPTQPYHWARRWPDSADAARVPRDLLNEAVRRLLKQRSEPLGSSSMGESR
jgi:hypothetical protein